MQDPNTKNYCGYTPYEEVYITGWHWANKSFNHERYKHETVLSSHIWECKGRGSTCTVDWKVLDRGQLFNPVTKTCKLCVRERFYIIRKPHLATLNQRQEIGAHCPHVVMSLISKIKKVKAGWGRVDQYLFCLFCDNQLLIISWWLWSCAIWNRPVENKAKHDLTCSIYTVLNQPGWSNLFFEFIQSKSYINSSGSPSSL